jgi:hypothetical protein
MEATVGLALREEPEGLSATSGSVSAVNPCSHLCPPDGEAEVLVRLPPTPGRKRLQTRGIRLPESVNHLHVIENNWLIE